MSCLRQGSLPIPALGLRSNVLPSPGGALLVRVARASFGLLSCDNRPSVLLPDRNKQVHVWPRERARDSSPQREARCPLCAPPVLVPVQVSSEVELGFIRGNPLRRPCRSPPSGNHASRPARPDSPEGTWLPSTNSTSSYSTPRPLARSSTSRPPT
ncbi:hypothetical protein BC628DRAFT_1374790 [Trametes gibbosa]|nr:hypothetical protein BC628DRAFT_1374790 [Trametes gibbosa]